MRKLSLHIEARSLILANTAGITSLKYSYEKLKRKYVSGYSGYYLTHVYQCSFEIIAKLIKLDLALGTSLSELLFNCCHFRPRYECDHSQLVEIVAKIIHEAQKIYFSKNITSPGSKEDAWRKQMYEVVTFQYNGQTCFGTLVDVLVEIDNTTQIDDKAADNSSRAVLSSQLLIEYLASSFTSGELKDKLGPFGLTGYYLKQSVNQETRSNSKIRVSTTKLLIATDVKLGYPTIASMIALSLYLPERLHCANSYLPNGLKTSVVKKMVTTEVEFKGKSISCFTAPFILLDSLPKELRNDPSRCKEYCKTIQLAIQQLFNLTKMYQVDMTIFAKELLPVKYDRIDNQLVTIGEETHGKRLFGRCSSMPYYAVDTVKMLLFFRLRNQDNAGDNSSVDLHAKFSSWFGIANTEMP